MEHCQDGGRKSGGPEAEFQERVRKNEHASSVEGFFLILDSTAVPYLKLAFSTRTNQTRPLPSSVSSDTDN